MRMLLRTPPGPGFNIAAMTGLALTIHYRSKAMMAPWPKLLPVFVAVALALANTAWAAEPRDDVSIAAKAYLLDRTDEDPWEKLRLLEIEQRTRSIQFCLTVAERLSRQRCIKYIVRDSGMLPMSRGQ